MKYKILLLRMMKKIFFLLCICFTINFAFADVMGDKNNENNDNSNSSQFNNQGNNNNSNPNSNSNQFNNSNLNGSNTGTASKAINKLNSSEISLNKTLNLQNEEHKIAIKLAKFVLLNQYNHLFLVVKRNELILNQQKIKGANE